MSVLIGSERKDTFGTVDDEAGASEDFLAVGH